VSGRTILVGYDGSQSADHAAAYACELGARLGAKVLLTFCVRIDFPVTPGAPDEGGLVQFGERVVQSGKEKLGQKTTPIATQTLVGVPAEQISALAKEEGIELVVVGRSNRGAMSRLFLGSVANGLAHSCPKPLVIVP
jgi:nucleotide-binding universal stress UspA family protein